MSSAENCTQSGVKVIITTAADILWIFVCIFQRKEAWHLMWIVCLADKSYEMPTLIFSEKKKTKSKAL